MKNNELENSKPVYIQNTIYSPESEISLIDIALVLVRRKTLIGVVLITFVSLGVFFSLSQKSAETGLYDYETSIFIGSRTVNGNTVYLEPPATLLSNIQYIYIPQFVTKSDNRLVITASSPDSGIITVTTTSSTNNDADAIKLLSAISSKAIADHGKYYESIRTSLSSSIKNHFNSVDKPIDLTNLSLQMASLKGSSTLELPRITKVVPADSSKSFKLILAISLFGGLFVGVFLAFFSELVSKVREASTKS
ncbi:MAG: hypothetical protein QM503_00380 [Bacteroidota bacterium]